MTSAEIVPVSNIAALEQLDPLHQELAITNMLGEARQWLAHAVEATEPRPAAQFKAMVATIAETTKQLGLSKEIQLDAVEMVRRAERGVGKAIRKGQEEGTVRKPSAGGGYPSHQNVLPASDRQYDNKARPTDFAPGYDLSSTNGGIYAMTDDVTDEDFEEALSAAKAEDNMARANIVRKVKKKQKAPESITEPAPRRPAPKISGGPKRNSTEMLENVNGMLQGIVQTLQYIDPADVDTDAAFALIAQIRESLNRIRKTTKEIENV